MKPRAKEMLALRSHDQRFTMTKTLRILEFDIDLDQIPIQDIKDKAKVLSKKRWSFFSKTFDSENDFLILLFHLMFVERLEKSAIAKIIGYKSAANVHHLLYDLGWNYPSDDENKNILQEASENSASLDYLALEHANLKLALENVSHIKKNTYETIGFQSGQEYARVFYYLPNVNELSPTNIAHLFNLTLGMTQDRLRHLGLNETLSEGIAGKMKRKSQDYAETRRSSQRTRRRAQYEHFAPTSSNNEEYFRRQLSDFIYSHVDPTRYEIAVGVNNTGIINPFEVDIPVIIYEPKQNAIFRFAIEYKDPRLHVPKKDLERKHLLAEKGWKYLEIIDLPEYSNSRSSLDRKIHQVCEWIKSMLEN
jgi:hypothetical protein